MRLSELNPRWCAAGDSRHGMGITFECPHCRTQRLGVWFVNPIDGGPKEHELIEDHHMGGPEWTRTGTTFDDLSLSPSIDASAFGHWHGYITNGSIT